MRFLLVDPATHQPSVMYTVWMLMLAGGLITAAYSLGCAPSYPVEKQAFLPQKQVSEGVWKFEDGNTTCYVIYQHGISCVKR